MTKRTTSRGGKGVQDGGGPAVHSYHDPEFKMRAVKILPGDHYVTHAEDEMLVTILGSCVSACIRDPAAKVGGLNHFLLPSGGDGEWGVASSNLRYGNFAMEQLVNDILKVGGRRSRLEIKLFGGASLLENGAAVGARNIEFVENYLKTEGLPVYGRSLGGKAPRRIHYFPMTGKVMMKTLRSAEERQVMEEERVFETQVSREPVAGSAELF